jgi:prepilin-type N-terminal cleavage/methylation domain-containing protein
MSWLSPKGGQGFTIIEVMIATAVFAVVLLITIGGFMQIAQVFYKSVVQTQTQQDLREIVDRVSSDIRQAPVIYDYQQIGTTDKYYQCIGSTRYTYRLNNRVDSADADTNSKFGILIDRLPGNSPCGNPYDASTQFKPAGDPDAPIELLATNERLNHFYVSRVANNVSGDSGDNNWVYQVDVAIATGRNQYLLTDASGQATCNDRLSISQYCSVAHLTTAVAGLSQ